jgi:Fe-S-cluster containining protein
LVGSSAGCVTGACCACKPDVFAYEQELLDRLPKLLANVGQYCPFFNRAKKNCGIYSVRPFACRIYYNLAASRLSCQNPAEETLQLFAGLKRHVEEILGPYVGGYVPGR